VTVVSLLTDFGLADTYVGQMKAAVLTVSPTATLVDVSHSVPPQDVQQGAFLLWTAVEVFPPGSIHLAVVDPGVGSARRPVAVRCARGDAFVGPDNGLLVPAIDRLGGCTAVVKLNNPAFWRPHLSSTFQGRDLFGPVAGHLANGVALDQLGPRIDQLGSALSLAAADRLHGQVIHVDTYGNLITNLPGAELPERFVVRLDQWRVEPHDHYRSVAPGGLLAYIGSAGLLEIAARDASATAITGASRGSRVVIEPS
jgi:S-adenosylmethionine hydrolase